MNGIYVLFRPIFDATLFFLSFSVTFLTCTLFAIGFKLSIELFVESKLFGSIIFVLFVYVLMIWINGLALYITGMVG